MALDTRLQALAQAVAADVKTLYANQGALSALDTAAKTSLVAAINELHSEIAGLSPGGGGGAEIDDDAGTGDTDVTWSADKITAALAALKSDLLDGVNPAFDTLKELADALGDQDSAISNLLTAVGNRVRYDAAQTLSTAQKLQACQNIGIGDPDADLVAIYVAAKE